jgi:hypothetical protein
LTLGLTRTLRGEDQGCPETSGKLRSAGLPVSAPGEIRTPDLRFRRATTTRYAARSGFCSGLAAPMFGRTGGSPVFRVCEAGGPRADPGPVRRGGATSSALTRAPRSTSHRGERPEPIPDRRLERVAELVASGPSLDVDQLVAIGSTQHDPVRATASTSPTVEGDGGNRCAARLELLPDRLAAQELVWAGA